MARLGRPVGNNTWGIGDIAWIAGTIATVHTIHNFDIVDIVHTTDIIITVKKLGTAHTIHTLDIFHTVCIQGPRGLQRGG